MRNHSPGLISLLASTMLLLCGACGFPALEPLLPNAVEGFTLDQLEEIQDDPRLTVSERREAIRTAIGAPMTPEGDRLVNFLLTFIVP